MVVETDLVNEHVTEEILEKDRVYQQLQIKKLVFVKLLPVPPVRKYYSHYLPKKILKKWTLFGIMELFFKHENIFFFLIFKKILRAKIIVMKRNYIYKWTESNLFSPMLFLAR